MRLVRDHVGRDPLERLGVLHQEDREVERREQLRLVGDLVGRDERAAHGRERRRRLDVAGPRDVERGVDTERAVEVEVELGLRHRAHERAQRALIEGHGAMVCGIGVRPRTRGAVDRDVEYHAPDQ